jgi:hypothetical protein
MGQEKTARAALAFGWAVSAVVVALAAILVVPEANRSEYFWHRLLWTEFLLLATWLSAGFSVVAPFYRDAKLAGGILPSVALVVIGYCALSFSAMMANAFVFGGNSGGNGHLVAQLVLFVITAVVVVFLIVARAAQATGSGHDVEGFVAPQLLCAELSSCEEFLRRNAHESGSKGSLTELQSLREAIQYSIGNTGGLDALPEYSELSSSVRELVRLAKAIPSAGQPTESNHAISDRVARLVSLVQLVVAKSKLTA